MRRTRLAGTLALLAVLGGGGVAYAGTSGDRAEQRSCATQTGNVLALGAVCPITVDPDVQVAPVLNLPLGIDLG